MNNRFPQRYLNQAAAQMRDPEQVKRQKMMEEAERKEFAKQQLQAMKAQQQHALQSKNLAAERLLTQESLRCRMEEVEKCKVQMMDHQLALAHRLQEAEKFVIQSELTNQIFMTDEPGSGKTFAILFHIALSKKAFSGNQNSATLIVVPPALVKQWMEAIAQFDGGLRSVCLDKFTMIQELAYANHHLRKNDIAVTSTDMFPIIRGMLNSKELGLHRVIVDEVDGVVDFQQIDCAPLNRPDIKIETMALDQVATSDEGSKRPRAYNAKHVVPPVPANLIIRVSASMNVSEQQETQFPVTICRCDPAFIHESIKLETPEFHTIRCPDIYIQNILKDFLSPKEIKALHALDFKSAVQKYQKRSGQYKGKGISSPVDVLRCLEAFYHHELHLNLGIVQEYVNKFPFLKEFDEGYGKDFDRLTGYDRDGGVQTTTKYAPRWSSIFQDLDYHVPLHVCEVYDDIRATITDYIGKNKHFRRKLNENGFCGGHCIRKLAQQTNYYKLPCCHVKICLECADEANESVCIACRSRTQSRDLTVMTSKSPPKVVEGEDERMDKIDALLGILLQIKDSFKPLKIILATEYSQVFTSLHSILSDVGLRAAFLEAGSPEKIDEVVKEFMDPKSDLNIVFCQITTVGRGLNLPIATHVINFQRLEPKIRLQTIGRAQRLGRTSKLHVYDILHKGE